MQFSDDDMHNIRRVSSASNDLTYAVDMLLNYINGDAWHSVENYALDEFKNCMNSMKDAIWDIEGLLSKLNHPDKWDFK